MSKKIHYECYRCEKVFDQMGGIKSHLKRKKPCEWKNKEIETSDEEVYQKSIEKKFHTISNQKEEVVNTIVTEEVKTIVKEDIKVQQIKEQNKLNIEILINKESVLQFLIGCVSSELDAFKFLTDREKGEIMLYVFCDNIIEKNIVPKYVAVSIVAGVIYLVNNLFNLGLKKRQISKVCDNVSEATIHKCYLDLNNSLEHIVPKYVLDEVIKNIQQQKNK